MITGQRDRPKLREQTQEPAHREPPAKKESLLGSIEVVPVWVEPSPQATDTTAEYKPRRTPTIFGG